MTNDERDQIRYLKMVKDGVDPMMAAKCVASDRKPFQYPHRPKPKVKPWRCPECGFLIEVEDCLECHNSKQPQGEGEL